MLESEIEGLSYSYVTLSPNHMKGWTEDWFLVWVLSALASKGDGGHIVFAMGPSAL